MKRNKVAFYASLLLVLSSASPAFAVDAPNNPTPPSSESSEGAEGTKNPGITTFAETGVLSVVGETVEIDGKSWLLNPAEIKIASSEPIPDGSLVYVNGVQSSTAVVSPTEIILAQDGTFPQGELVISVEGSGYSNSVTLNVDNNSPAATVQFNLDRPEIDGKYYISGSQVLNASWDLTGSLTGVKEVSLLKEGVTLASSTEDSGSVQVAENGVYQLQVQTYFETFSKSFEVVVNNAVPSVDVTINGAAPIDGWYTEKPVLVEATFGSEIPVLRSYIEVNGQTVKTSTDSAVADLSYDLATFAPQPLNGKFTVKVGIESASGVQESKTVEIRADLVAPQLVGSGAEGTAFKKHGATTYFVDDVTLSVTPSQSISGIKEIEWFKDGSVIAEGESYTITESGTYSIKVTNWAGEVTPYSITELFPELSPAFEKIESNVNPEIKVDSEGVTVDGKVWYAAKPGVSAGVTGSALDTMVIKVNGSEVFSGAAEAAKNVSLEAIEPQADWSYLIEVEGTNLAGQTQTTSKTFYLDDQKPEITGYTFTIPGIQEGGLASSDNTFGFFFRQATAVQVEVKPTPSGLGKLLFQKRVNGSIVNETVAITGNSANIPIPENFKGFVGAEAENNVGTKSAKVNWDGIISESQEVHINNSALDIVFPATPYRDSSGLPLYVGDISATLSAKQSFAGLRSISWDSNGATGSQTIDLAGNTSGPLSESSRSLNLVTGVSGSVPVQGNANGISVSLSSEDRVGWTSSLSRSISIDKDAPVIDVSYNQTNPNGYYNSVRTAQISITDRNFNPSGVVVEGTPGSLGSWNRVEGTDTWVSVMTFGEEKEYSWSIYAVDLAGNRSATYSSESFTIDTIAPALEVSYSSGDVRNGKFYNTTRVATIRVVDATFDGSNVNVSGATLSGWTKVGDVSVATASFTEDGEYNWSIQVTDLAGNQSNTYESGEFIVWMTAPEVTVDGLQNGVSYKKNVMMETTFSSKYLDPENTDVTLTGRSLKGIELEGGIRGNAGFYRMDNPDLDIKNDDFYTLNAEVADLAGNVTNRSLTFSINRFGSQFSFLNRDFLGKYLKGVQDVKIVESSVDQLSIPDSRVELMHDGKRIDIPKDKLTIDESGGVDSNWKYVYTLNKDLFKTDGMYVAQVFSKTLQGDENSSLSQEYVFFIDTEAPEIHFYGADSGEQVSGTSLPLTIEVQDQGKLSSVQIMVNGELVEQSTGSETTFEVTLTQSATPYNVQVTAKDMAGNVGEAALTDVLVQPTSVDQTIFSSWIFWVLLAILLIILSLVIWLLVRARNNRLEERRRRSIHAKAVVESMSSGDAAANKAAPEQETLDAPVAEETPAPSNGSEGSVTKKSTPSIEDFFPEK